MRISAAWLYCGPLFCAMLGFSAALATSHGADSRAAADVRLIGSAPLLLYVTPLRTFSDNVQERDLGDVLAGVTVTRYARVTGGVPRYVFTSSDLPGQFSMGLTSAGQLFGTPAVPAGNTALRFRVITSDGMGSNPNTVSEMFRVSVANPTDFKFAINQLSMARQYRSYIEKLEVLGGITPFRYTLNDIVLNGTPLNSLSGTGLALDPDDGTLYGKPLIEGVLTFKAVCVDPNGTPAKSRLDQSVRDQTFTLLIEPNKVLHSEVLITKATIKGSTKLGGKDSIALGGQVNLPGISMADLSATPFEIRIGEYDSIALRALFNTKGKATFATSKANPSLTASVSSKGALKIAIKSESFGVDGALGTLTGKTHTLPVQVRVGNHILGSETLEFSLRKSSSGSFMLQQKLGKANVSGAFMLTKVKGDDASRGGVKGDKWQAAVLAIAPKVINTTGIAMATTSVGRAFETPRSKIKISKGKISGTDSGKNVTLSLDVVKGKGSIKTNSLAAAQTDIGQAKTSAATTNRFSVRVQTFDAAGAEVFSGEDSMALKKKSSDWLAP